MSKTFGGRTLLVGLGGIGMGYDDEGAGLTDSPVLVRKTSRTHANAIQECDSMQLVGGVDPDSFKREVFEQRYRCGAWPSVAEVPLESVDTVVIATPTSTHLPIALEVLSRFAPSGIICEKPLGFNAAQAIEIRWKCKKQGASLAVNYFRLYLPWVRDLQQEIRAGLRGRLLGGSVLYSHGLRRNGCHLLNLVIWLTGYDSPISATSDGYSHDEPSFKLRIDDACVRFQAVHPSTVRVADVTLVFERGVLRMVNGGQQVTWETATAGASCGEPKYATPVWTQADDMLEYQLLVYQHLAESDVDEATHRWRLDSVILTQEIMDEVTDA